MNRMASIVLIVIAFLFTPLLKAAEPPIYVILWFDTEDYILPASDDAALRLAAWLSDEKIRATFKVVGEKARTLERRGRRDVIAALKKHEIGYHSNWHSVPPTPAQYLNALGWDDGVAEFDRRERPGFDDVARIFGQKPLCYGQPGGSWGPQSFGALRSWGVPVYLDGGSHINLDNKPLYYCGLLTLYKIDIIRTRLGGQDDLVRTQERFATVRKRLQAEGGGIISIVYHPCEFVHQEFWDAVNFRGGANPPRDQWKLPRQKSPAETQAAFENFEQYVRFIRRFEDVKFITALEAATIWRDAARSREFTVNEIHTLAASIDDKVTYQRVGDATLAPSEIFALVMTSLRDRFDGHKATESLRLTECTPFGPSSPSPVLSEPLETPLHAFRRAVNDSLAVVNKQGRVPSTIWLGSKGVPPEAFLAAAAKLSVRLHNGEELPQTVTVFPSTLETTRTIAADDPQLWRWIIFPPGFSAPQLMEQARRQAWTIKPAVMH